MPRDNERIIQICSDLSQSTRKALIELLEAEAPMDMIGELIHSVRFAENAVNHLSQSERYSEGPAVNSHEAIIRRCAEESLAPFLQRLDAATEKIEALKIESK